MAILALVSVGIPVLNGSRTLGRALDDLQAQTFADLEILVCDNVSDDDTVAIAEARAADDLRIKVFRFKERVDILHSFKRALDKAESPYFMFAPADDRWYATFVEETLAVLEERPDLAACTGRVAFTSMGRFSHIETDTHALEGTIKDNISTYLLEPGRNSRAFSLFRREALTGTFPEVEYPGWDFQMIARSLVHGGHYEIPKVLAERDITPYDTYLKQNDRLSKSRAEKLFPLGRLAVTVMRDPMIPKSASLVRSVISLTLRSHWNYSSRRMPRWHAILRRIPGLAKAIGATDYGARTKRSSGIGTMKHPPLAR